MTFKRINSFSFPPITVFLVICSVIFFYWPTEPNQLSHISCLFQSQGNEIELEPSVEEPYETLLNCSKDEGASLIRRKSARGSIRESQAQDRKLSIKEAEVSER